MFKISDETSAIDNKWTEFISKINTATIYHHPAWFAVLEEESKQKILRLVCKNNSGKIVGIFPLQYTKGFPFGLGGLPGAKRLSSLPRTPVGGPLVSDNVAAEMLVRRAVQLIGDNSDYLLQIKSFDDEIDKRVSFLMKYFWREIYITDIPLFPAEIRFGDSRNHSAIKRAVNKAIKNGVQVRYAESISDLKTWYQLYIDTMQFHVTPSRSYDFFYAIWDHMKPKGFARLILAEQEKNNVKNIIAGSMLFYFNNTVVYAFNGSSRADFELRPNDLLHWHAIHDAQKEGYLYYDLGEVSKDNVGLAAYKKKWGSRKLNMYHYYYPKSKLINTDDIDHVNAGVFKKKLWKLLPLKVTSIIGKNVYKHL